MVAVVVSVNPHQLACISVHSLLIAFSRISIAVGQAFLPAQANTSRLESPLHGNKAAKMAAERIAQRQV